MSWFAYFVNMVAAGGFTVFAVISAKRIGGAGPWMLAAVGAIDVVMLTAYRILFATAQDFSSIREVIPVLDLGDTLAMVLSAALALVGFGVMMPKVVRR